MGDLSTKASQKPNNLPWVPFGHSANKPGDHRRQPKRKRRSADKFGRRRCAADGCFGKEKYFKRYIRNVQTNCSSWWQTLVRLPSHARGLVEGRTKYSRRTGKVEQFLRNCLIVIVCLPAVEVQSS
jgi:hypothetical protein